MEEKAFLIASIAVDVENKKKEAQEMKKKSRVRKRR